MTGRDLLERCIVAEMQMHFPLLDPAQLHAAAHAAALHFWQRGDDLPTGGPLSIPGYVAAVAGTDHASSAHDTLTLAGREAMEKGRPVVVLVTPAKTSA